MDGTFWRIVANGTKENGEWTREFQIPTFFVEASSAEEAESKARTIICAPEADDNLTIFVSVGKMW